MMTVEARDLTLRYGDKTALDGMSFRLDGGKIYDPKTGKTYDVALRLAQTDKLTVTGYLGMKMLGKSFTWTRAPGDLPRCEGAPPPA